MRGLPVAAPLPSSTAKRHRTARPLPACGERLREEPPGRSAASLVDRQAVPHGTNPLPRLRDRGRERKASHSTTFRIDRLGHPHEQLTSPFCTQKPGKAPTRPAKAHPDTPAIMPPRPRGAPMDEPPNPPPALPAAGLPVAAGRAGRRHGQPA